MMDEDERIEYKVAPQVPIQLALKLASHHHTFITQAREQRAETTIGDFVINTPKEVKLILVEAPNIISLTHPSNKTEMVKNKMKLTFLDKKSSEMRSSSSSSSSWPWLSCHQPRTLSFRAKSADVFNSDPTSAEADPVETVVRGLRSDRRRLFFEPDETSSIIETKAITAGGRVPFKDSFVLSMESRDPYLDFRKSMEEMVEAHALRHLEALQELLCWYLRLNAQSNHVCILAAFVDLLLDLAPPHSSPCASSPSPLSFSTPSSLSSSFSTHCVNYSSLEAEEVEVDAPDDDDDPASTSQVHDEEEEASCLNA